jgi:hypothetical protein
MAILLSLSSILDPSIASAQAQCAQYASFASPNRGFNSKVGPWNLEVTSQDECNGGERVAVLAQTTRPGDGLRSTGASGTRSNSILSIPIACRRDDYMFLPPDALGGIPCVSIPMSAAFDPEPLAVQMAAQLPPPDLRIGMNPARGMVNIPTWFWVEGYDGGALSQSESVLQRQTVCHTVTDRGPGGLAVLGSDHRPTSHVDCVTTDTTFVVEVRLWPNHYAWDFGDNHGQSFSCGGQGDCPNALGVPYVDAFHASTIQHPYVWSSLGVNGSADAYTIKLAINFEAEYRVSVNGNDQGGWHGLSGRELTWTASHQVQEAQAVLTRP